MLRRSLDLLDPDFRPLVDKILELIKEHNLPFYVFETLRSRERQKELYGSTSKTKLSKHMPNENGFSEAVDIVLKIDNKWTWDPEYIFYYDFLGKLVEFHLGDQIKWGGRFKNFYDGPHFEWRK